MSVATTYRLHPVSAMPRSASPTTSSSTTSDRTPPPFGAHHHHLHHHSHRDSKFLPPATATFSPVPTSAPRRPLSPSSLRGASHLSLLPPDPHPHSPTLADVDPPLDPERAFAARGKFPAPPTGHELMALFPPAPPLIRPGPTSGYFQREERKFFAQAGREIVRVRLEIDTPANAGGGGTPPTHPLRHAPVPPPPPPPHPHAHQHPHAHPPPHQHQHRHDHHPSSGPSPALPPLPGPPAGPPLHSTSPRTHLPPVPAFPPPPPQQQQQQTQPPQALGGPGYPPPQAHSGGGGAGDAMVVEEDDESWRLPTPHNARRRAGKHTRRVIVK
ncbi:hypothetical protein BC628DRAFT_1357265 [Trametes gibbosa]|nr:hypothetical protein BC628DRAFT_1357265 [Trametes gibbosa]